MNKDMFAFVFALLNNEIKVDDSREVIKLFLDGQRFPIMAFFDNHKDTDLINSAIKKNILYPYYLIKDKDSYKIVYDKPEEGRLMYTIKRIETPVDVSMCSAIKFIKQNKSVIAEETTYNK